MITITNKLIHCHSIAGQTVVRERVVFWQYEDGENEKYQAWKSLSEFIIRAMLDVRVLQQKQMITSMFHHVQVNGKYLLTVME